MACELPPCPPCPPPPYPPCPQVCAPAPDLPPCRSKPIMRGLHWAQTKRKLAQAILLSICAGAAVYVMGLQRKAAYTEYYKRGCFEDWADEMARKGLFQSVPKESLKDFNK
ncbi:hypothetical protein PYW08_009105 [Mythimna loreyi]|uniref:Uncharacterized protein n=1 Tax=Mythimna loreyi TaxID=667449 RepID=A0ACC2Q9I1_9NEOP|nr:hypothetical protein PYW08_009105 [Mythimna loreyi]